MAIEAHAGADTDLTYAQLGTVVVLDGTGSPPGSTFKWYLLSKPPGSAAAFMDPDTWNTPRFGPIDVTGTYLFFLVVTVGAEVSEENPLRAADTARSHITCTTENLALTQPAAGMRNWQDHINEVVASVDEKGGLIDDHLGAGPGKHHSLQCEYSRADVSRKNIHPDSDDVALALNDLDDSTGKLTTLTTTVKTSNVGAINELDGEIGVLSTLDTTEKGTIVGAINEVHGELGGTASAKYMLNDTAVPADLPNAVAITDEVVPSLSSRSHR
jgi:hypothetical protein